MRRVAIFPLPETVFFPGMILPLHLFEPRYRQMGRDVVDGERELVVVLLKPGWEQDYGGTPPVHEVATLGTIEDHEDLEDGRLNIVLYGSERVRLMPPEDSELREGKLYRERRIEPAIEQCPIDSDDDRAAQSIGRLRSRWQELSQKSGATDPMQDLASSTEPMKFDVFVNQIAGAVDIPPRLKQTLLEEDDLLKRAARLEGFMDEQLKFWRTLSRFRDLKPEDPSVN